MRNLLDPILTITIKYESFMKWSGCDVMILFPPPSCFLKAVVGPMELGCLNSDNFFLLEPEEYLLIEKGETST